MEVSCPRIPTPANPVRRVWCGKVACSVRAWEPGGGGERGGGGGGGGMGWERVGNWVGVWGGSVWGWVVVVVVTGGWWGGMRPGQVASGNATALAALARPCAACTSSWREARRNMPQPLLLMAGPRTAIMTK